MLRVGFDVRGVDVQLVCEFRLELEVQVWF